MRAEVLALFRELADLSPDARARYFEEHPVDPKVRAEVESLLAFDAASGSLAGPVLREARALLLPASTLSSGSYGPYRTVGVLGEGGMGIVYLAEQAEPVRRRVALKVIKHTAAGSLVARFESERQALALLDHPNIATLYDAGETADGRPWFAMEYVPGLPITDYCDNNHLGLRERLLLFQQVCRAVEHAHEKGIIHRDLKPSNILVAKAGGVAMPKVIDFGVAKTVNLRLTERTLFTEMGMLIGTPEYMSPEQAGDAEIESTTDIYSLGVVLYELLVGATPFDSKSLRRAGYNEICRIIRETDPPRPTARLHSLGATASEVAQRRGESVAALSRTLRGDLEWITMKALEKEPARRYASPGDFAADLDRHLHHQPVEARAPSAGYRFRKFVRRRRLELTAAAGLLLAIVAGIVAVLRVGPHPALDTMTQHRIDLPGATHQTVSTDGQHVVYQDWDGDVIYWDATSKTRRPIFQNKLNDLADMAASRDFSKLALFFRDRPGRPGRLAVIKMDGSGYRELWRGDGQESGFGASSSLESWSWDSRWFLYHQKTKLNDRLFLVSPITGEHREFTSWEKGALVGAASFSPDGHYVAWEVGGAQPSRIYVKPVQGGAPRVVYETGAATPGILLLLDWAINGHYLIIASDRTGRRAVHLLPVRDGQAAGEPVFIRNVAPTSGLTTKTGALIYRAARPGSLWSMHLAALDAGGRPGAWRKLEVILQNNANPWPNWSPDSNQIVYRSNDAEVPGNTVLRVHNTTTGEDREVYRTASGGNCTWASHKPIIVCLEWGPKDSAVESISPVSGKVEHLGAVAGTCVFGSCPYVEHLSSDDKALYFVRIQQAGHSLSRWQIGRRKEELVLDRIESSYGWPFVSPDERWLVRVNEQNLEVKPIAGGAWSRVASGSGDFFAVTPDGVWIYFDAKDPAGTHGLFRAPTGGGVPERVGDFPAQGPWGSLRISPDGSKIIVAAYDLSNGFETWSLENFVPAEAKR